MCEGEHTSTLRVQPMPQATRLAPALLLSCQRSNCRLLGPGATAGVSQARHSLTYFNTLITLFQYYFLLSMFFVVLKHTLYKCLLFNGLWDSLGGTRSGMLDKVFASA